MRLPITPTLHIESFSGGLIQVANSLATNVVFKKYPDGTLYATQRPGVNIYEDASATVTKVKGRGIYHWARVSASYFVNDNTVYKGSYAAPVTNAMTSGSKKVYFFELGTYLVIIDPENNKGWYITAGASTTLVAISDLDFPPNQTPPLTLASGGAVLNGILYVYTTSGAIFNSSSEDPTVWGALDFISSELEADPGVMMFKHGSDHIAAIGSRTIQFFYDNANATASPLNVRTDISHTIGTVSYDSLFNDGNTAYFIDQRKSNDCNVMALSNFGLTRISNDQIDAFLTATLVHEGLSIVGSGFSSGGHTFYVLTTYYLGAAVTSLTSLVYDIEANIWGGWELMHAGIDKFPLIDFTTSTSTQAGNGILTNGDIITLFDGLPLDSVAGSRYVATGYVFPGYVTESPSSGTNIQMQIITGKTNLGSQRKKSVGNLKVICNKTTNSNNVLVQHTDEVNNNYNAGRNVDISNLNNKLTRMGSFITRNHKLTTSPDEQVRIEGIEIDA